MSFTDSKAAFYTIPTYCGARTYTFVPSLPSFLTMNTATGVLTLTTNDPVHAGSYNYAMEVKLTSYPTVVITKNFQVTITCEVLALSFSTAPANIFVEPGITT